MNFFYCVYWNYDRVSFKKNFCVFFSCWSPHTTIFMFFTYLYMTIWTIIFAFYLIWIDGSFLGSSLFDETNGTNFKYSEYIERSLLSNESPYSKMHIKMFFCTMRHTHTNTHSTNSTERLSFNWSHREFLKANEKKKKKKRILK